MDYNSGVIKYSLVKGTLVIVTMLISIIIYFVLFSFCGWICECIYCSVLERKFVNRGFLNGPFCPVYGFGGLIVVYILAPFRDHIALLFLLGMLCTTLLEYITSFVLEKMFDTKWWDYTSYPLNIHGRVCLPYSLMFGGLSVFAVRVLYPPFSRLVGFIPYPLLATWAVANTMLLVVDAVITARSIFHLNHSLGRFAAVRSELLEKLAALRMEGKTLSQKIERFAQIQTTLTPAIRQPIEALMERFHAAKPKRQLQYLRLFGAFPHLRSLKHPELLHRLAEAWKNYKNRHDFWD